MVTALLMKELTRLFWDPKPEVAKVTKAEKGGLGLLDGDGTGSDEMGTTTTVAAPISRLNLVDEKLDQA